jgi:hypothetical protein
MTGRFRHLLLSGLLLLSCAHARVGGTSPTGSLP